MDNQTSYGSSNQIVWCQKNIWSFQLFLQESKFLSKDDVWNIKEPIVHTKIFEYIEIFDALHFSALVFLEIRDHFNVISYNRQSKKVYATKINYWVVASACHARCCKLLPVQYFLQQIDLKVIDILQREVNRVWNKHNKFPVG